MECGCRGALRGGLPESDPHQTAAGARPRRCRSLRHRCPASTDWNCRGGPGKWRPATRSWWIFVYYAGYLASELDAHGHTVIGLNPTHWRRHGSQHNGAQHNGSAGDDWAKALFARVGPERADAVFKALTRVLHPDNVATGDTELQRELNDARAEMEKT